MPRILHFADAHIDMANYGQHDPTTGLPERVMDFLKSLDTIVKTAIVKKLTGDFRRRHYRVSRSPFPAGVDADKKFVAGGHSNAVGDG